MVTVFAPFRILIAILPLIAAVGCGSSSSDPAVTPTIGTIATIQGTVMRADNYFPIAGAVVSIGGVSLTTRSDGTYAISGLRPGETLLSAERIGFQPFVTRVSLEGARTVNIFLLPSLSR
jgi:hypothetical protein